MKKLLLAMVAMVMVSCATYQNGYHGHVYGVVEDVVYVNHKYRLDVWDYTHMRYHKVTIGNVPIEEIPQIGDTIKVK